MVPADFSNPRIEFYSGMYLSVVDNAEEFVEAARGNTQVKEARINIEGFNNMADFRIFYKVVGQALRELESLEKVEFDATDIDAANGWSAITCILNQTKDRGIKAMHFDLCGWPEIEQESVTSDEVLREHTTLEELKVHKLCGDFDDFYNPFPLSLAELPELSSVMVKTAYDLVHLRNFNAPTSGKLLKLSFEGFKFPEDLSAIVADAVSRNPKLEVVEFCRCYLEGNPAAAVLFEKIGELSSLRTLHIDRPANLQAYYGLAKYFSRNHNSLNEVLICAKPPRARSFYAVIGLHSLLSAMKTSALLPLVTLEMKIDSQEAVKALNDELTRSGLVATAALKNFKLVFFSGLLIGDEIWSNICSMVAENTKLTRFELVGWGVSDVSGFFRAMPTLNKSNTLDSLRINVSPSQSSTKDWYKICRAVAKSKTVTRLEVGDLGINGSAFRHGMSILNNETKKLESLHVSMHYFGKYLLEPFLDALKDLGKHSPLVELHEGYSVISVSEDENQLDVFLKTPLKALREIYTLTSLFQLYFTKTVSPEDKASIESEAKTILKLNRHGRRYMLEDNPAKESGVALLMAVVDDLDCIFYHIKENPILFCCRDNDRRASLEDSATLDTSPMLSWPLP